MVSLIFALLFFSSEVAARGKLSYLLSNFLSNFLSYRRSSEGPQGRGAATDGTMLGYTITIAVISLIVSAYG